MIQIMIRNTRAPIHIMVLALAVLGFRAQVNAADINDAPTGKWRTWIGIVDTSTPPVSSTSDGIVARKLSVAETRDPVVQKWLQQWTATPASIVWNDVVLDLIVKYQQNPLRAARTLAYVHVAMHDALVMASREGKEGVLMLAAVHGAASATLSYFYPQEPAARFGAMGYAAVQTLATTNPSGLVKIRRGWEIGQTAAHHTSQRALNDGADATWDLKQRPAIRPGLWQAAPPLNAYRPLEPMAGRWHTWVLRDGSELSPPPPPVYDSREYWEEVHKVMQTAAQLTEEQKKIAEDWNLGFGTVTPAGVWNRQAREHVLRQKLNTAQTARLFAALNVAMMDAFISCWSTKFRFWTERPVTVIRAKFNPEFLPHIVTPPFPSYPSGHATVSGAASEVLASFFPEQSGKFRAMAVEASKSRLYGGIHFPVDNEEGLKVGQKIGRRVIERLAAN